MTLQFRSQVGLALGLALLLAIAVPLRAQAADRVYAFVIEKQEEKKKSSWSLAEWLTVRDKMRMQDLWLAMHSPSPYEFFVASDYLMAQTGSGGIYNGIRAHVGAYASMFGLEALREPVDVVDSVRWQGSFNLRIFGRHVQGTNIILRGGVRHTTLASGSFRNPMAGASMSIYILKFFGVEGSAHRYFASTLIAGDGRASSMRWEARGFIDFSFFRIYGGYFSEAEQLDSSALGTSTTSSRSASFLGGQLFF